MTAEPARLKPHAPGWPSELSVLGPVTPAVLWWLGRPWVPDAAAVAIVGSRRASAAGLAIAHSLGRELAARGIVVVSGFARGIDAAAHSGAVASGGRTVAVCGCGLDIDYPRGHSRLREAVLDADGAIVSEFAPTTEPRPYHFPQRNRIIAALARVVVVVEADERSGALSTARWAADLSREVLAVPGPLHSPASRGTNRLIRDGARPFLEIEDVLDALNVLWMEGPRPTSSPAAAASDPIVELASGGPTRPDDLAEYLGMTPSDVAVRLASLDITVLIRLLPGGLV